MNHHTPSLQDLRPGFLWRDLRSGALYLITSHPYLSYIVLRGSPNAAVVDCIALSSWLPPLRFNLNTDSFLRNWDPRQHTIICRGIRENKTLHSPRHPSK